MTRVTAERVLLGAAMLISTESSKVVADHLARTRLSCRAHRTVLAAVQRLHRDGHDVDVLTVVADLERRGRLTAAGGTVAVDRLTSEVPSCCSLSAHSVPDSGPLRPDVATFKEYLSEEQQIPGARTLCLLDEFMALYASKGLLPDGKPVALHECCPNADDCWRDTTDRKPVRHQQNGAVMLPWIGEQYEPGRGLVVLAVNPNIAPDDVSDLLFEYSISWERHHKTLAGGSERDEGSLFAYNSTRAAAAVLDYLDGSKTRQRSPQELAPVLHRTARLQSVKCVPRLESSKPMAAMWRNCPPFLLADELDLLRPAAVLVLGTEANHALKSIGGFTEGPDVYELEAGSLKRPAFDAEVFFLSHPSARGRTFPENYEYLLSTLRALRR